MYSNIEDFHDVLLDLDEKTRDLKMIIGISLSSEDDSKKFLGEDIFVGISNYYQKDKIYLSDWRQLVLDFNSKFICHSYIYNLLSISKILQRFSKIIFDWSVFKFLDNPYFILYLYYILLEEKGELYIEIAEASHFGILLQEKKNNIEYDENTFIKSYGTKYVHKNNNSIRPNRISHIHNFLSKFLLHSKVELLHNNIVKYPIKNNQNIESYFKITKICDFFGEEEFSICKNIKVKEYEILSKL